MYSVPASPKRQNCCPLPEDIWLLSGADFRTSCLGASEVNRAASLTCPSLKEATSLIQGLSGPTKWQVALEAEATQATTSPTAFLSLPAPADGGPRGHWIIQLCRVPALTLPRLSLSAVYPVIRNTYGLCTSPGATYHTPSPAGSGRKAGAHGPLRGQQGA